MQDNAVITVPARHKLGLRVKQVLHLPAEQCLAHMVLHLINFLTHNFARYRLILKIL